MQRIFYFIFLMSKPSAPYILMWNHVCRKSPVLFVSTIWQVLPLRNSAEKIHFNNVVIFLSYFCTLLLFLSRDRVLRNDLLCSFLLYYLCVSHDVRLYSNHIYLNGGIFKTFFYNFSCVFSVFLSVFLKHFININQWALRKKRAEELQ